MPKKKRPASKPKAKPSKTKAKPRRGSAPKARKKRASVATTRAKQTAMKVLAGAAAGAGGLCATSRRSGGEAEPSQETALEPARAA
jgi:hypothetical protein